MTTDKTNARPEMATCTICNQSQPLSSMAVSIEDGAGMVGHCCYVCEGEQVGRKFEDATALILWQWSMDSSEDDHMTQEGWGYCARFGRFLLFEDSQGFVSSSEYADAAKADKAFEELYAEGWGYSEDDALIAEDGSVYFDGKRLHVWPPRHTDEIGERRKLARIRLEMARTGFYPNVWEDCGRGNLRLVRSI